MPELFDRFLDAPRSADYIKELLVRGRYPCYEPPRDGKDGLPCQYRDRRMNACEKAVKEMESIPSAEKERWIYKIHAGDEDPLMSLLVTQLHYLTSVKLELQNDRSLLFEILKGIVEDPRSLSLSQLRNVEIHGQSPNQHMGLAVCFAALPSVVSLTARNLSERVLGHRTVSFDLPPNSSNIRELNLDGGKSSIATISNLIAGIRSLRSFQCHCFKMARDRLFANMLTTLQQHASSSLEELSILCSEHVILYSQGRVLGEYTRLRILTLKYFTTDRCIPMTTDDMTKFLPASVEILNFDEPYVDSSAWFQAMVESIISTKRRTIRALRQLNIHETLLRSCPPSQAREMYLKAAEEGIQITSVPYDDLVTRFRRR